MSYIRIYVYLYVCTSVECAFEMSMARKILDLAFFNYLLNFTFLKLTY